MREETKTRIAAINSGIVPDGYKKTKVGIMPVEWELCHFKKMFERLKRKNTENNTNVLTISAQYGLINQEEFFNKSVASEDKSNYYLLYKGDFAYNKSYSNGYPFGAIKALEKYDKGVVSPLYICFSPTEKNKCPAYYLQYFESGNMNREIQAVAQEGARNHGLLNIGIDDFLNSYLVVPPLHEQQKIAEILSTQDKLIELQEKKIEQLKMMKKAYLQKMFPKKGSKYPELRFKGFTDAWEHRKWSETVSISTEMVDPRSGLYDDFPHVAPGNIESFTGRVFDNVKTVKEEELISGKFRFRKGDIIYGKINPQLGKYAFAQYDGLTSADAYVLNAYNGVNQKYLFTVLQTKDFYDYSVSVSRRSGMPKINRNELNAYSFTAPNEEEQGKIGEFFLSIDYLITLHQRKSEQEKQKKKALMQLLLTGKVRVKL